MKKTRDFLSRFNFHTLPFTREISVRDRFILDPVEEQAEYLYRAMDKRMSAAVVAPAGTGKTMLLRILTSKLSEVRYDVRYIKVTGLSKRDLCREIAQALDLEKTGNYPALIRRIQERFAQSMDVEGRRPVLILDEAQDMRPDVLGILTVLTNFEMDSRLVVGIILAGQPKLKEILRQERLESVTRRMAHYASLNLLSSGELARYVKHRCTIAGAESCPFDDQAMAALYELTKGNLRAVDYLSLKSLEAAHDEERGRVDHNNVIKAKTLLWPS